MCLGTCLGHSPIHGEISGGALYHRTLLLREVCRRAWGVRERIRYMIKTCSRSHSGCHGHENKNNCNYARVPLTVRRLRAVWFCLLEVASGKERVRRSHGDGGKGARGGGPLALLALSHWIPPARKLLSFANTVLDGLRQKLYFVLPKAPSKISSTEITGRETRLTRADDSDDPKLIHF